MTPLSIYFVLLSLSGTALSICVAVLNRRVERLERQLSRYKHHR